jgi:hypothetical protein
MQVAGPDTLTSRTTLFLAGYNLLWSEDTCILYVHLTRFIGGVRTRLSLVFATILWTRSLRVKAIGIRAITLIKLVCTCTLFRRSKVFMGYRDVGRQLLRYRSQLLLRDIHPNTYRLSHASPTSCANGLLNQDSIPCLVSAAVSRTMEGKGRSYRHARDLPRLEPIVFRRCRTGDLIATKAGGQRGLTIGQLQLHFPDRGMFPLSV